jgi:hypothetical protein
MVNLDRPTVLKDAGDKSTVVGAFDQFAKAIGLAFVGLYVLGLVISNVALQRLGLSDFAILQPRCIATGASFTLYIVFAMLLVATPVVCLVALLAVAFSSKPLKERFLLPFFVIIGCLIAGLMFPLLASFLYGGLTPWSVWPTPERPEVDFQTQIRLVWGLFGHGWAAWTGVMGLLGLTAIVAVYIEHLGTSGTDGEKKGIWGVLLEIGGVWALLGSLLIAVFVLAYAIPGFARDVYPNLGQGVGGGQPIVARLQISGTLPLIEDGKIFRRVTEATSKEPKSFVFTEPLVIWYQSASFVYVTPLAVTDRRQLPIALDAKSVQVIQQVAQAVEVRDSTRITAIHNLP